MPLFTWHWKYLCSCRCPWLGVKILKFFDADPGSGMETIRIRDGKKWDPGSGINIPDPQHWNLHPLARRPPKAPLIPFSPLLWAPGLQDEPQRLLCETSQLPAFTFLRNQIRLWTLIGIRIRAVHFDADPDKASKMIRIREPVTTTDPCYSGLGDNNLKQ